MDSEKRTEIWAVIQAFCAVYCSMIGTWALFRPPVQMQPPMPSAGGSPLTPASHIVWWFWILIAGFIVCAVTLAIGTIVNIFSRRVKEVEEKTPVITVNGVPANQAIKTPHITPGVGLTLRSASIEPYQHRPDSWYPRQIALYFSNDGDEIHLGVGKWIKDRIGIQEGRPSRFVYFRKNHLGRWDGEATDKVVYSGNWVKISVGLDSSMPDNELKRLADEIRLGTLEIPSVVSGTAIKIRTNIFVSHEVLSRL